MTPESNGLHAFFEDVVAHCFSTHTAIDDPELARYVAGLLTHFTAVEQLYPLRDDAGNPVRSLGVMLKASDPVHGRARSFDEERRMRKHIGDFALFSTGMYPENTHQYAEDTTFAELVHTGKESYYIVSQFDLFEYAEEAPLFARLTEQFDECRYALTKVSETLHQMQGPKLLM